MLGAKKRVVVFSLSSFEKMEWSPALTVPQHRKETHRGLTVERRFGATCRT